MVNIKFYMKVCDICVSICHILSIEDETKKPQVTVYICSCGWQ